MKKILSLLGFTVLFGAGCLFSSDVVSPPVSPTTSSTSSTTSTLVTPTTSSTSAAPSNFIVDSTWKTYTNNALHFSFQWPIHGSYAPTWSADILKNNPCGGSTETQDVNGVSFCDVHKEEGAAGTMYLTDNFATSNGSNFIVLSFSKRNYGGEVCKNGVRSSSPNTCVPFNLDDYKNMLKTIIGTFQYEVTK